MTMQTIRPSQVPQYLRTSSFYFGLNVTDDDEEFTIPSNHMKLNTKVNTLADMTELLNTIRFWGSDVFPRAMIDFAARQKNTVVESILKPYHVDLPFLSKVCSIVSMTALSDVRLEKAMESGDLNIVQYFHNKRVKVEFTARAIALAAGKGAIDCLQYALCVQTTGHFQHRMFNEVYSEAVRNGCMDSIHFLRQRGFSLQCPHFPSRETCVDLPEIAASSGQLEVLKYLHRQRCSIRSTACAAADEGHWDCFEYAVWRGSLLRGETFLPLRMNLAQRLARAGQLKLFPIALSREKEIDEQTTLNFAKTKNWELLQLCIQYIARPNLNILAIVVERGFLACLQQLHQICVSKTDTSGQSGDWLAYVAGTRHYSPSSVDLARLAARAQQWDCRPVSWSCIIW